MDQVVKLVNQIISEEKMIKAILSNLRQKNSDSFNKVDINPVRIKEELKYQFTYNYSNKVIHRNLNPIEAIEELNSLLYETFKQCNIYSVDFDYQILVSKKGKINILKKKATKELGSLSHNRSKNYILEDGEPVDFLIRLGVMNESGKVLSKRYDKFKQINRFLELIADVIPKLNRSQKLNIVDFGCGKSYLTFALYYYLVKVLELNVNIIGLDLKMDVINFCNEVASDLSYDNLRFIHGDIKDYQGLKSVDMVVTLHACDNATDAAIVKAINWNCQAILSVPCCQHEFYEKIHNTNLEPMLKHGFIKEKLSSLVTDSLRGLVLEALGYQVQLLEFIDMEHTPKNTLIRAIKTNDEINMDALKEYKEFKRFWDLKEIYIEKELGDLLER